MTKRFEFGAPFQRALLRMCMTDESFNHQVMKFVDPSYFTTKPLGWIFRAMQEYHQTYAVRCTDLPLREMARRATGDEAARYIEEVERVIQLGYVTEEQWVKARLQDFVQRNLFSQAHKESAQLYNNGNIIEAYDVTQRAMEQIRNVTFDVQDQSFFFEEFEERQKRRYAKVINPSTDVITTGIPELDHGFEGGIHIGEMFIIIAYAKVGKSTWLANMGFVAVRAERVPVLHIGLEGSLRQTEDRYEALFSGELYSNVKRGEFDSKTYTQLISEYKMLKDLLIIRQLGGWDITVLDIEAVLKENRHAKGHKPLLVVVDYLDLLRSRGRADSETQHQMNAARDLKRLAEKEEMAIWTGSQAKRPRSTADEKEHVVKAADIADAYAKVRIADGYGSLNQTRDEKKLDQLRLYWEEYRDAPASVYLRLYNDRARQRLGKRVEYMSAASEEEDDD